MAGAVADHHIASKGLSGCCCRLSCTPESGHHHCGFRPETVVAEDLQHPEIVGIVAVDPAVGLLDGDVDGTYGLYLCIHHAVGQHFPESRLLEWSRDVNRLILI